MWYELAGGGGGGGGAVATLLDGSCVPVQVAKNTICQHVCMYVTTKLISQLVASYILQHACTYKIQANDEECSSF
jgi:hypothetical protein